MLFKNTTLKTHSKVVLSKNGRTQSSLFGDILDWVLAPLFLLWPLSIGITYIVAQSIANVPFDQSLSANVIKVAQQVKLVQGKSELNLPSSAQEILRADQTYPLFFQVRTLKGMILAGDTHLPLAPDTDHPLPGVVQLREAMMGGIPIRIAHTWVALEADNNNNTVLIQVAETLERRSQLAREIVKGVIIPHFLILPIAVLLLWFSLSRGIAPLNALQERIRDRRSDDLSPIPEQDIPQELMPLIAAFNELLSHLAKKVGAQKRFVADAAHQLKTPLAGLRTQAELALRHTSPEDMESSLKQLIDGAERMTHLVNQLLTMARAEDASRTTHSFFEVDLTALAKQQTQEWVGEALLRRLDLGFETLDQRILIKGNPTLLAELIKNLLDNAMQYTPQGGKVTVRLRQSSRTDSTQQVDLEVEDTGPGIPLTERKRVFDRFYRMLGNTNNGSGLGLAIVDEIAQQHGASISIQDPVNSPIGTRIIVSFPALSFPVSIL